ncbi:MAG: sulfatase-like hydrolase/transferase [Bacillota bacterium]|nr:sulfatase-like hydrolase/transferase [Bacillota bacterium]
MLKLNKEKIIGNLKKLYAKESLINLAAILILPLLFSLAAVFISNAGFVSTLKWVYHNKKPFILTYFLSFGIVNLFYIFKKKIYITLFFVVSAVFTIAAYISKVKYMYRGEPLMPSDLNLGKEGMNIQQNFLHPSILKIIICVILLAAGIVLGLLFFPKDKRFKASRIYIPVLSIFLIFTITYSKPIKPVKIFNLSEIAWDQGQNYQQNGFLLGFDMNIKWLNIQKPVGYSKEKIASIVNGTQASATTASQKPNIIVIQSEAFWDITKLPNVKFSKDPLPYFHTLQNEYPSGYLYTPVFGGGTTNTEFQVLTGMTEHFLPPGVLVYNQYIHNPLETAVTALKDDGYGATAIHSYMNWFYKRDQVYKHFGFDNFDSAEFFNNPQKGENYIKDQEITNKILDVLHQGSDPKFIFAVTMENHGPYPVSGNYKANVTVQGNISESSREMIERYSDNLCDVDSSLKSLITEIQKESTPTIVIIYGDHLPYLGADYQAYKETGYYSGTSREKYDKMYSTPYIVWNNIGLEKKTMDLSANFLLPDLFNQIGLKGNTIMDYDNQLFNKGIKIIPMAKAYDASFGLNETALADFNQLQYDMMFGKGYSYGNNPPKDPSGFYLGLGKIGIDSASFNSSGGKNEITVSGKNFTQTSSISINGKLIKTDFKTDTSLTAELPDKYKAGSELEISVGVKDTIGRIIATSNTFKTNVPK